MSKAYQSVYSHETIHVEIGSDIAEGETVEDIRERLIALNPENKHALKNIFINPYFFHLTGRFHSTLNAEPRIIQSEDGGKWLILDFKREGMPLLLEPWRCLREGGLQAGSTGYTCNWIEKRINGKIIDGINVVQGGNAKTKHGYFMDEDGKILLFWFLPQDKKAAILSEVYIATDGGMDIQSLRNCILLEK
jgi:hypothetical protein